MNHKTTAFVDKHPMSVYLALTFALGLPLLSLACLRPSLAAPESPASLILWIPLTWTPNLAALLTAALLGRGHVREILAAFVRFRIGAWKYAAALLPLGVAAAIIAAAHITQNTTPPPPAWPMLVFTAVLHLILGPLGEEGGWRGFLLPRCNAHFGPAAGALIVGIIWALWHLPLWWLPASPQAAIPFGWFALNVVSFSIVMAWLYRRSHRSLVPMVLFHWAINYGAGLVEIFTGLETALIFQYTGVIYAVLALPAMTALLRTRERDVAFRGRTTAT